MFTTKALNGRAKKVLKRLSSSNVPNKDVQQIAVSLKAEERWPTQPWYEKIADMEAQSTCREDHRMLDGALDTLHNFDERLNAEIKDCEKILKKIE